MPIKKRSSKYYYRLATILATPFILAMWHHGIMGIISDTGDDTLKYVNPFYWLVVLLYSLLDAEQVATVIGVIIVTSGSVGLGTFIASFTFFKKARELKQEEDKQSY